MTAAVGLVVAVVVGVAAPASGETIDDLRSAVTAAREAATAATGRYTDAENRLEAVEIQIADAQHAIAADRDAVAALRALARTRAVEAYKSHGTETGTLGFDHPLARARRQKLLAGANARDDAAIAGLEVAIDQLDVQERALRDLQAQARDARDRQAAEQADLEKQLAVAQRALAAYEEQLAREDAARQERERAILAAQRASAARSYAGAYVATGLVCPIRGPVSFVDSWGAPRADTGPHQGVDLMSPRGTPNVAVVSGTVEMHTGATSGNGVWLHGDDGNLYYSFHLDAYEGGPRHVSQGDVVGYTGNTGDASGGATHTHFEVHPGGGAAVNPYPTVVAIC